MSSGEYRVAFTGGRSYDDRSQVRSILDILVLAYGYFLCIKVGDADGADQIVRGYSIQYSLTLEIFTADWNRYGKSAGPIRNRDMLESGVDILVAFPGGKGTADCIRQARELNKPVLFIGEK